MTRADHPRRRRRNRLLLAGLLPSIVALLVAGHLVLLAERNDAGLRDFADGDFDAALGRFAANRWPGVVEPWVAPFNEGDAHYRSGDYARALGAFLDALPDVPPEHECAVRLNVALTRERLGDAGPDPASAETEESWRAGRDALAGGRCTELASETDPGLARDASDTDARLAAKLAALFVLRETAWREGLDPAQRRRVEHLEEQNRRAREREAHAESAADRPPAAPDPQHDPEDPQEDPQEDYAW